MKYAISFRGYDYSHLSDELYDLPEAIFHYQKAWEFDSDSGHIVYGAIYSEVDTTFIDVFDERLDDVVSVRVATGDCLDAQDRFPPEGIFNPGLAAPRGIYKLPENDINMSDDERRAWIKQRLEELKIEY